MEGGGERGIATLITLLVSAIAIALASAFGQAAMELVEKTIPSEDVAAYVVQRGGGVDVVNPSKMAVDLSKLKVVINGRTAQLSDNDGDGIWEPGEKLSIDLTQVQEDVVVIEVIYDGKVVQRVVYVKPLPLHEDRAYPTITYTGSYDVRVEDDTGIVAVSVYVGTNDSEILLGSYTPFSDVNTIKHCFEEYTKTGSWSCNQFSRTSFSLSVETLDEKKRVSTSFGSYEGTVNYVRVVAYDVSGKPTSVVLIDDSPPKVEITRPNDGEEFVTTNTATVDVAANAWDDYGLISFELFLGSSKIKDCSGSTCSAQLSLTPGDYTIRAVVTDTTGQTAGDQVFIRVIRDTPPTVAIVKPADGATIETTTEPAEVRVVATVNDDFGVQRVEFYVNTTLACTDSAAPYECYAQLYSGSHTITVRAYDSAGQAASDSITVTVSSNTPPTALLEVGGGEPA